MWTTTGMHWLTQARQPQQEETVWGQVLAEQREAEQEVPAEQRDAEQEVPAEQREAEQEVPAEQRVAEQRVLMRGWTRPIQSWRLATRQKSARRRRSQHGSTAAVRRDVACQCDDGWQQCCAQCAPGRRARCNHFGDERVCEA
jgi:hypothetical protein